MQTLHDLFMHVVQQHFNDPRSTFGSLRLAVGDDASRVTGQVLDSAAAMALIDDLRTHAPHVVWQDDTTPLVGGPQHGWTIVTRAVADVRHSPSNRAERVTQALWGEPCEVLQLDNEWAFVRTSHGYLGWTHAEPLYPCDEATVRAWDQQCTHLVISALAPIYTGVEREPQQQCALLPFGVRVATDAQADRSACIRWPDGSRCWIDAACLLRVTQVPQQNTAGLDLLARWLPMLIGVPYLWGGRTPFGYDCSGLVQALYTIIGVQLPRDADQQSAAGQPVPRADLQRGDLLFFDTDSSLAELPAHPTTITHVAYALDRHAFVHASRRAGGVAWGSLDPLSPCFLPDYERRLVGVRRYLPQA
jgi:hypothetical protein